MVGHDVQRASVRPWHTVRALELVRVPLDASEQQQVELGPADGSGRSRPRAPRAKSAPDPARTTSHTGAVSDSAQRKLLRVLERLQAVEAAAYPAGTPAASRAGACRGSRTRAAAPGIIEWNRVERGRGSGRSRRCHYSRLDGVRANSRRSSRSDPRASSRSIRPAASQRFRSDLRSGARELPPFQEGACERACIHRRPGISCDGASHRSGKAAAHPKANSGWPGPASSCEKPANRSTNWIRPASISELPRTRFFVRAAQQQKDRFSIRVVADGRSASNSEEEQERYCAVLSTTSRASRR